MEIFRGSGTALVTPFTNDGIDFDSLAKLVDFQIINGTSALIVLGTTGEPATMTDDEKVEVVKFVVSHTKKRVPVIAGSGGNNTKTVIENSQKYAQLGVDGLLIVTPYYNKCTQKGLVAHFESVAKSVDLPIILYNVPSRTGVNMLPATVKELSALPNIVGLKEASGNIDQISEILSICDDDFAIYSGDDGIILPVLSLGGKGVISVASNIIPRKIANLCTMFFEGNIAIARKIQHKINRLVKGLFSEVNPIPVKGALSEMGMIQNILRMPLTKMSDDGLAKLIEEMKKMQLV